MSSQLTDLEIERYFFVLLLLDEMEHELTQKKLCDRLFLDKVMMVRIIDYFTEHGYVERKTNPNDRREQIIVLSPKGKEKIPFIRHAFNETNNILFQNITEEEKNQFYSILMRMKQNVDGQKE